MSNLVPEKRLNKNGVLVTKHVRAGDDSTTPASRLPAPSLAKVTMSHYEAMGGILHLYDTHYVDQHLTQDVASWQETLEEGLPTYSAETLGAYYEAIFADPRGGFEDLLVSALRSEKTSDEASYILFVAKHDPWQDTEWMDGGIITYAFGRISRVAQGLQSLDGYFSFDIPENIYGPDAARSTEVLSALVQVTNSVHSLDGSWGLNYTYDENGDELGVTLESNDLIELVAEYPEKAEMIGDIISERETTDAEVIRTVIESGHDSLNEGAL